MKPLDQLRLKLEEILNDFFILLEERKIIINELQTYKSKTKKFYLYDEVREKELFAGLKKKIEVLSLKELYALSLIIESHCLEFDPDGYPEWSSGQLSSENGIKKFINPNLLNVYSV